MGDFLRSILEFPTVLFTALLGIVPLYWLAALAGLVRRRRTESHGPTEASTNGEEARAVAGGRSGATVADGAQSSGNWLSTLGALARHLRVLGLGGVPCSVSLSILALACWLASLLGMRCLRALVPSPPLLDILVGILAVALGLAITVVTVRTLRPLFAERRVAQPRALIGSLCTITSERVDSSVGRARIDEDDGSALLIDVRCFRPNSLKRGGQAVIYEYDEAAELYHVAPSSDALLLDGASRRPRRRLRRRHRPCPSLP